MSDIPDWAKNRACDIANAEDPGTNWLVTDVTENYKLLETFARYIAAHEEAPVDPLLLEAREIAANEYEKFNDGIVRHYVRPNGSCFSGTGQVIAKQYREGKHDSNLNITLAALRRGIEIAGGGNG